MLTENTYAFVDVIEDNIARMLNHSLEVECAHYDAQYQGGGTVSQYFLNKTHSSSLWISSQLMKTD